MRIIVGESDSDPIVFAMNLVICCVYIAVACLASTLFIRRCDAVIRLKYAAARGESVPVVQSVNGVVIPIAPLSPSFREGQQQQQSESSVDASGARGSGGGPVSSDSRSKRNTHNSFSSPTAPCAQPHQQQLTPSMRQGATTTSFRQSSFRGAVNSAGFQSSPMVNTTTMAGSFHAKVYNNSHSNKKKTSNPIVHRSNRSSATESIATQSMGTISAKSFATNNMSASLAGNHNSYSLGGHGLQQQNARSTSPSGAPELGGTISSRVVGSFVGGIHGNKPNNYSRNIAAVGATMSFEERLSLGVQRSASRFYSTDIQQDITAEGEEGGDHPPVMIISSGGGRQQGRGRASSSRRRLSRKRRPSRKESRPSNSRVNNGGQSGGSGRFDSIGGLFGYPEDIDSTFRVSPFELAGDNVGRFFLFLILFLLTQAAANIGMLLFREQSLFEGDASSDNNEEHSLQEYLMIPPSYCYYTMPLVLLTTFAHMLERADPTPRGAFPRKVVRILAFFVNAMFWVLVGLYVSDVMDVDNLESRFVGISGIYCVSYLVALFYFPRKFTAFGGSAVSDVVKRVETTCAIFAVCSVIRFSLLIDPIQDWLEGSVGSRWFFAIYMPLDIIPCLLIMNFLYRRTQNVALVSLRNHKRREKKKRKRQQQEEERRGSAAGISYGADHPPLSSEASAVARAQQKSLECGPLKSGFKGAVGSSVRSSSAVVIGDSGGGGGALASSARPRPSVGVNSAASTPFNSMAPLRMDSHRSVLDGFASPSPNRMAPTRHGSEEKDEDAVVDRKDGRPPLSSSPPPSHPKQSPSPALSPESSHHSHCATALGAPLLAVAGDSYSENATVAVHAEHDNDHHHHHHHDVEDDEDEDDCDDPLSGGDGEGDHFHSAMHANANPSASYLHSKAVSALLFEELVSAAGPLSSSSADNNMKGGGRGEEEADDSSSDGDDSSSDEEYGEEEADAVSDSTTSDEER